MKHAAISLALALAMTGANAETNDGLRSELQPLQFLIGACWAGQFPDGARTDVHCYESVFEGMHLRDRHAVTGGATTYRGETVYSWSGDRQTIAYVYWNSYGGVSTGTATPDSGKIAFPDESYTGPNGATITISSSWENITADGYDSIS
ncbi:MAG: hypothetical protein AAGE85_18360, partial [Pseudomonadota bacterium]